MPDFDPVAACLQRLSATIDAAEAHGLLCGLLMGREGHDSWLRYCFDELPDARDINTRECLELQQQLYNDTREQLNGEDMALDLLLPDDDEEFAVRLMALASWCQGLLYGLGVLGEKTVKNLSEQGQECLDDLLKISQMDHDEEPSDENEALFTELVEHVRLSVLYLNEEINPVAPAPTVQQ